MRGLKPQERQDLFFCHRRIFYRCVDWNMGKIYINTLSVSRIFYRCVDWNFENSIGSKLYGVASFTDAWIETGIGAKKRQEAAVASFTDAWIETTSNI